MSRIGKLPISLPASVTATLVGSNLVVKWPKGELQMDVHTLVNVTIEEKQIVVDISDKENQEQKALWGLTRALIANIVIGVSEGYKKTLEIQGVGYKFDIQSPTKLTLALGFSHKVEMITPEGVTISPDANDKNAIHISGIDKQKVGFFAAQVRSLKKPEPYKGKGIRYSGEYVRRKAGKTAGKK